MDSNEFYLISAHYPNEPIDKGQLIQKYVLHEINQRKSDWKIGGEIYLSELNLTKEFPERAHIQYEYHLRFDTFQSNKYNTKSYLISAYEYTGGAHGTNYIQTFNFKNSSNISLEEMLQLKDSNDIELTKLIAQEALRDSNWTSRDMLLEGLGLAYLKADGRTIDLQKCQCDGFNFTANFNHFVIDELGIVFIFDKYQIAPGVAGNPRIHLTWKQLKHFLL
ncbi:MAG: DUF3298 domain-containing protein [Bacteroidetes bacterium]|nr:DUF3298 domain-containing protein [Bacteroidota bacterium]